MADNGDVNTTTKQINPEANTNDIQAETKSGWLLKRTKMSRKWKKKWFMLKEDSIVYGNSPEDMPKSIALDKCEITTFEIPGRPHTFYLKPNDTQRKHIISAETEAEAQEWMQAICLAKAFRQQNSEGTQACVVQ